MTKAQSTQTFNAASGAQSQDQGNAQSSYQAAQQDVGNYQSQLAKFAGANPFGQGGQFQTAQNQGLADTAAAGSQQAAQTIQSAGVRSGQNPAAGIAAAEQVNEANTRNLSADQANATTQRIGDQAGYNQQVLSATAVPEQMEASLAGTEGSQATGNLNAEEQAAKTPSFADELVNAAAGTLGAAGGKAIGGAIFGCWIAARLFGGWGDSRTIKVRLWLNYAFGRGWYGGLAMKAYRKWGERMADTWMLRSAVLTAALAWLFGHALAAADRWIGTAEGARVYEAHWRLAKQCMADTPEVEMDRNWHAWAIGESGKVAV